MVVSSGFMDHVLAYDRSEVYLRANGLIPAAAQPINNTLSRQQQVSVHAYTKWAYFIFFFEINYSLFFHYYFAESTTTTTTAIHTAIDKFINYATISQCKSQQ